MPLVFLVLAIALSAATLSFGQNAILMEKAHAARLGQAELSSSLDRAAQDAIGAVRAAIGANQLTAAPPTFTWAGSVCPVVDAANAADPSCQHRLSETISFTGLGTTGLANPSDTLANVNTAPIANGAAFERDVSFDVTLTLRSADGLTILGTRNARGLITVVAACDSPVACAAATVDPQIHFDGWRDSRSGSELADTGRSGGRCPTADATCNTQGLDSTASATADDSRIHRASYCYDSSFWAYGGPNLGDRCNPTGNPAAAPANADAFGSQGLNNGNLANGAYAR